MGGAGDQLDVDIGPFELFRRVQSAESGADHHNPVPMGGCGDFGVGAHGWLSSTGDGIHLYGIARTCRLSTPSRVITPTAAGRK
jgi:hypothetical protein